MKFFAIKGADKIEVEITEEALIKMGADAVSSPNHATVESVYAVISSMAGGNTRRVLKPTANATLHAALHAHSGDGHTHTH